jgi:hypothetical protein
MSFFSTSFIASSAAAAHQQRVLLVTESLINALLEEHTSDVATCLSELTVLGGGGGAVSIGRAWLAFQEDDVTTAEQLCREAIRAGVATLALAAMNRLLLARIAQYRGNADLAADHVVSAYAQASPPITRAAIQTYTHTHGLPHPPSSSMDNLE